MRLHRRLVQERGGGADRYVCVCLFFSCTSHCSRERPYHLFPLNILLGGGMTEEFGEWSGGGDE